MIAWVGGMRLFRFAVIALPLALAACDVPGLVAAGVKGYENRPGAATDQAGAAQSPPAIRAQPVAASSAPSNVAPIPPAAPIGGVSRPEPVSVEPLK